MHLHDLHVIDALPCIIFEEPAAAFAAAEAAHVLTIDQPSAYAPPPGAYLLKPASSTWPINASGGHASSRPVACLLICPSTFPLVPFGMQKEANQFVSHTPPHCPHCPYDPGSARSKSSPPSRPQWTTWDPRWKLFGSWKGRRPSSRSATSPSRYEQVGIVM